MSSSESVVTSISNGVFTVCLNRPKANAFDMDMISAAQEAFKKAARDPQIRCVLLTGSGSVFSAGQDIKDFRQREGESFRGHLLRTYNPLILQIRRLEKPVLAAINGSVAGAGLGIALAADLRIAADSARFIVGFIGIGLVPDSAVSLLLPALIGLGRASEHAFTNEPITSEQALTWGLVNKVVPVDELQETAARLAESLAAGPVHAMGLTKRAFNNAVLKNLEQVLDYEAHNQDIAGRGSEHKEGVQAFLEKRQPQYQERPQG
jgi:2-(1,2-epoxy-1,2-dihydrophenyl)acetyl-CoA isomerase